MVYFIIIFAVMALDITAAIFASYATGVFSLWYATIAPLFTLLYIFLSMGIAAIFMCVAPQKWWKHTNAFFCEKKWEKNFYNKIGIKKWKEKIPDWSASNGFPKGEMQGREIAYLERFIYETCYGEMLHFISIFVPFSVLALFEISFWWYIIPILITNVLLQIPTIFIQRYNRIRLLSLYNRKLKQQAMQEAKTETQV